MARKLTKVKTITRSQSGPPDKGSKLRGQAISGGKLLHSQSPRTRKERISVIESEFGNLPIR